MRIKVATRIVVKTIPVRLILFVVIMRCWHMYQLSIKNTFMDDDLKEEIYMEQSLGYVVEEEESLYGLKQSPRTWFKKFSKLVVCGYVVIIGDDHEGIKDLQQYIFKHFQTKYLGQL
ncbi:hypothetical protein CR513_13615, partial [Mucuna pruriens]